MSSNDTTTTAPLDWQNTKDILIIVQNFCDYFFIYGNAIFQVLCVIQFGYRIFQKDPIINSAYYYILVCGYAIMSSTALLFKFNQMIGKKLDVVYSIFRWYMNRTYAVENTVLALNRFTGIYFFFHQRKIWEGKGIVIIMILLYLYPFMITAHTLGSVWCWFEKNSYQPGCIEFFNTPVLSISNMTNGCIALVLGILTAFARKIKGQEWAKKERYETFLLVQSIISTILLLVSEIFSNIATEYEINHLETFENNLDEFILYHLFWNICNYVGLTYHSSSAILIIILSKGVRDGFVEFYRLYYIPGIQKPSKHIITPVHSLSGTKNA